jgi:DNA-binding response OmpR family regulator
MSPQERIAELEAEVAYYRSEHHISEDELAAERVRKAFRLSPQAARVLLAIYGVGDRLASWHFLDQAAPETKVSERLDPYRQVQVRICNIRKVLGGRHTIENVWGTGYRLTPETRARVGAVIGQRRAAA